MAIEHVLSVFTSVAGKLDFVSASIWRRTRTLSIVGHGCEIEALAELNLVRGNLGMLKAELSPSSLSNGFTVTSKRERSCLAARIER